MPDCDKIALNPTVKSFFITDCETSYSSSLKGVAWLKDAQLHILIFYSFVCKIWQGEIDVHGGDKITNKFMENY